MKTKKIQYNSPSGYVWIGKYLPPFEKNKNGYGFIGIMLEDCKTHQLQCHICGKWYENLSSHVTLHHKIPTNQYKIKFGLNQATALKSKRLRIISSNVMKKNRANYLQSNRTFERNNLCAGNRKNKPKTLEAGNKVGACDLQILDKITNLSDKLHKTPA